MEHMDLQASIGVWDRTVPAHVSMEGESTLVHSLGDFER